MSDFDPLQKQSEFQQALDNFVGRLEEERNVLGAVLVGSLDPEHLWSKDSMWLWLIEADGVQKRHRFDGEEERLFRTLVENDINLHCEIIPRSRFRRMLEGNSRTAFNCSFFAKRELLFSKDPSIQKWFEEANSVAVKDQQKELVAVTSWSIWAEKSIKRLLDQKSDLRLAADSLCEAAHAVAAALVVESGEVYEGASLDRAIPSHPKLFDELYLAPMKNREDEKVLRAGLKALTGFLEERAEANLKPVLDFLSKKGQVVPLTELCDHFAYSQLYPWHLEAACEWLVRSGRVEKLGAPYKLTKKSRTELEEPAYSL